ncbi:pyridoxamine 5'-phosphate oxidase family protein [Halopelagius fulvigenes]|uniref:Pyridoxamine 5'-phosphate oxidase family protein n=1 Tax=Halopelagius fulvigenes TaxID=1198324 RepID=A0ABD5U7Y8_9EURY
MQGIRWVQMSVDERNAFLGRGGTGVIAFAEGLEAPPFTIPVSYGYDAEDESFYYRLAFPPSNAKSGVVERQVTFVAYGETEAGWQSVVAAGRLEDLSGAPYESSAVQKLWAVQIPDVDIFDRPREEIPFREYRLVPERITGRKEVKREV